MIGDLIHQNPAKKTCYPPGFPDTSRYPTEREVWKINESKVPGNCRGYVIVPEGTLPETNSEFAPEN